MKHPKLSVIVPIYDTEPYLERCMDSIINQSISNIEIIVINDCSKGDTDSIIAKYLTNSRVRYFKFENNKGLSAVRNFGLEKAEGEYIVFCDSDDWVDLFLYENMCESLERTNADVAICGTKKEFPSGEDAVIKASFEKEITLTDDTAFKIMTFQYDVGITITPSATNKMVRKSFLKNNTIAFLEGVYYEDLLYSFQLFLYAKKIVCVPNHYYHYFRRDNSVIISISKHHIESFYLIFDHIKKFLIEKDLFDIYKFNYYKFGERFYNLIIRQIFEFEKDDFLSRRLFIQPTY